VTFDQNGLPISIEEKPQQPRSNWAITGLYFFDNDVVRYAFEVKPSARGELEITDLQMRYLSAGTLRVQRMGRGFAWLDTGTFESLIEAASFVQTLETRQGMKVACLEEIAFRQGFIGREQVLALAKSLEKSGYGNYLIEVVESI
jgi:glucose-1-phosphate thymidylyltransferase